MKKIIVFLVIVVLLIPMFLVANINADSKTLGNLLDELDKLEQNLKNLSNEKQLTEEQLKEITDNMVVIGLKINDIEDGIISNQKEIERMNEEINKKKK